MARSPRAARGYLRYVAGVGVLAAAGTAFYSEAGAGDWEALYGHLLARSMGWCALIALLLSLACSPLRRILQRRPAMARHAIVAALPQMRRALGMGSALLAAGHALVSLWGPLDGALPAVVTWPFLRTGLAALVILALLFVTSFPRVNRALRVRAFKSLHRLAHGAAILILLHLTLGPHAPRETVVIIAVVYGALLALRLVPSPRGDGS